MPVLTLSAWDLVRDTILLPRVQAGRQGVTWKFSDDKWSSGYV